ncbi:MAG: TspO/MBR family protein [Acidobacteriota bacterium]
MKQTARTAALLASAVTVSALAGTLFTPRPGTETGLWYGRLKKSPLNPPAAVFGPVWTLLYALIAISAFRVWNSDASDRERKTALTLWTAQLGLNAAWTPIFFGAKQPALALCDLVALIVVAGTYNRKASEIDQAAALLFVPYMAWLGFALFLNSEVVRRNP